MKITSSEWNDICDLFFATDEAILVLDDIVASMPRSVRRDEIDNMADRLASAQSRVRTFMQREYVDSEEPSTGLP